MIIKRYHMIHSQVGIHGNWGICHHLDIQSSCLNSTLEHVYQIKSNKEKYTRKTEKRWDEGKESRDITIPAL